MTTPQQTVSILGATGSIGQTAAALLVQHAAMFKVMAVVGGSNAAALAAQAIRLKATHAVLADDTQYQALKHALYGTGIAAAAGESAVLEAASIPADITIAAIMGAAGLKPTLKAIEQGGRVALANKESLVCAGMLLLEAAKKYGTEILPLDSEHSAIFQIFTEGNRAFLEHLTLTASGGPFREYTLEQLHAATPAAATCHPVWAMGQKISVDSATLMNKGLEVIEACYLFGLSEDKIDVLVHPQSIIHGMAHYVDGSVLAQLAYPHMTVPLAVALGYPHRLPTTAKRLDLRTIQQLDFFAVDDARFPCLSLARQAFRAGGSSPVVLNTANEMAVAAFLRGEIAFTHIAEKVAKALDRFPVSRLFCIEDVLGVEAEVRAAAF